MAKRSLAVAPSLVEDDPSAALAREERAVLADALARAEETRNVVEDALVGFGRWLLVHVFQNQTAAALGDKRDNAIWQELVRRAGGPTLRLSRRFLHVAVAIAAYDKRINDDTWRLLEPGRKELLLPLADDTALRRAAAHVVKLKLSQRATNAYVRTLREAAGAPAASRLTPERAQAELTRVTRKLVTADYEKRLMTTVKRMNEEQRRAFVDEALQLRAFAQRLVRTARGEQ